ncbi:unnamed protein product [Ascophyllum nodosum]
MKSPRQCCRSRSVVLSCGLSSRNVRPPRNTCERSLLSLSGRIPVS